MKDTKLHLGDFTNSSKNYDLITAEKTSVIELEKNNLVELTNKFPSIKKELLQIVNKQLFNPEINAALSTIAKGVSLRGI